VPIVDQEKSYVIGDAVYSPAVSIDTYPDRIPLHLAMTGYSNRLTLMARLYLTPLVKEIDAEDA
jgi:hypothetical protein